MSFRKTTTHLTRFENNRFFSVVLTGVIFCVGLVVFCACLFASAGILGYSTEAVSTPLQQLLTDIFGMIESML